VVGEACQAAPPPLRSERSRELTPEERSRGGLMRAVKIREAKLDAMAEGRPHKRERRRRRNVYGISDPYARVETPAATEHDRAQPSTPAQISGPGLDAHDEAIRRARRRGGIHIDLWAMFRERDRELEEV
jgi:hypothetical protein